jgi:hypothetical protein
MAIRQPRTTIHQRRVFQQGAGGTGNSISGERRGTVEGWARRALVSYPGYQAARQAVAARVCASLAAIGFLLGAPEDPVITGSRPVNQMRSKVIVPKGLTTVR